MPKTIPCPPQDSPSLSISSIKIFLASGPHDSSSGIQSACTPSSTNNNQLKLLISPIHPLHIHHIVRPIKPDIRALELRRRALEADRRPLAPPPDQKLLPAILAKLRLDRAAAAAGLVASGDAAPVKGQVDVVELGGAEGDGAVRVVFEVEDLPGLSVGGDVDDALEGVLLVGSDAAAVEGEVVVGPLDGADDDERLDRGAGAMLANVRRGWFLCWTYHCDDFGD